jgi:tRNA A-37 threonylcarbamoyl transferase component Bud32
LTVLAKVVGPVEAPPLRVDKGVPPGFLEIRHDRVVTWVREAFSFLLDEAGDWDKDGPFCRGTAVFPSAGRGQMVRVSLGAEGKPFAVVRHYRRGGLIRHLLADRYLGAERFFREVRVAELARAQGVSTAEVLALRTEERAWGLYAADLVTREIEGATDLAAYLDSLGQAGEAGPRFGKREVTRSVASLLRSMHRAGICHADLNLRNILLQGDGNEVRSFVIDLDKARVLSHMPVRSRVGNLVRLYRSAEKLGYAGERVTWRDCLRFVKAYSGGEEEVEGRLKDLIRQGSFSLRVHRFFWCLLGGSK